MNTDPPNLPLPPPPPGPPPSPEGAPPTATPAEGAALAAAAAGGMPAWAPHLLVGGGLLAGLAGVLGAYGTTRAPRDGEFTRELRDELEGRPLRLSSRFWLRAFPFVCPACGAAIHARAGRRNGKVVLYVNRHEVRDPTYPIPLDDNECATRCPVSGLFTLPERAAGEQNPAKNPSGLGTFVLAAGTERALRDDWMRVALRNTRRRLAVLGALADRTATEPRLPLPEVLASFGDTAPGRPRVALVLEHAQYARPAELSEEALVPETLRVLSGPRRALPFAERERMRARITLYDNWSNVVRITTMLGEPSRKRAYQRPPGVSALALYEAFTDSDEGLNLLCGDRYGLRLHDVLATLTRGWTPPAIPADAPDKETLRALAARVFVRLLEAQANGRPVREGGPPTSFGITDRVNPKEYRARFVVRGNRLCLRVRTIENGVRSTVWR